MEIISRENGDWIFLQNPFRVLRSFKQMEIFAKDHHAKLSARKNDSATLLTLFNQFSLLYQKYNQGYTSWQKALGRYKGSTVRMDNFQTELSKERIGKWESGVRWAYSKDSPEYQSILPQGSEPFQTGGRDMRISAVRTLSAMLADYPNLAQVKTDVDAFLAQLEQTRLTQEENKQNSMNTNAALHLLRQELLDTLYQNLLHLLLLHHKDTTPVLDYFQVEMIRSTKPTNSEDEPIDDDSSEDDDPLNDPDAKDVPIIDQPEE